MKKTLLWGIILVGLLLIYVIFHGWEEKIEKARVSQTGIVNYVTGNNNVIQNGTQKESWYNSNEIASLINEVKEFKNKGKDPELIEEDVLFWSWIIGEFYKKNLVNNIYERLYEKHPIKEIETPDWKLRKIKVTVVDINWKPVKNVKIYLWWYYLGETDKDWKYIGEVKLSRIYDYMYFQAYTPNYLPWHKKVNAVYMEGRLIPVRFVLKPAKVFKVDPNNIKVDDSKVVINIKWDCVLKTSNGNCYNKQALMSVAYVNPDEIDKLNIIRKAIYKSKLVNLISNWMAYVEFYSTDGKKLIYNDANASICYKVWKKAIEEWDKRRTSLEWKESDWYWWFDKTLWVRKQDANTTVKVDKEKWLFCYNTTKVY